MSFSRIFVSSLCFVCLGAAQAQISQQVKVVEYLGKESKKPLAGVNVSVFNAPPVMSDASGDLVLNFRTLHDGDRVSLRRVDKSGYEVFNKDAVEQWSASSRQTFRIVLCESSRFRALCDQYQATASANYERQYQKDQQALEAQYKAHQLKEEEYKQKLEELTSLYNDQLDNLDTYVDRFARIDLESLSAEQQRIIQLIQEGKFDEAIAAYEAADYLKQYTRKSAERIKAEEAAQRLQQVADDKQRTQEQLLEAICNQVNTYALAGGMENYQKITRLLKNTADADTTCAAAVKNYFVYCMRQNYYEEAEKYGLIYARQKGDMESSIYVYSEIGSMYNTGFHIERGSEFLQRSLALSRPYIENGTASLWLQELYANVQLYLAEHYFSYNDYNAAATCLKDAAPTMQQLYDGEPSNVIYLSHLVASRTMQAYLTSSDSTHYQEALGQVEEMLALVRPRLSEHPMLTATYSVCLSFGYNIAGDRKDYETAMRFNEESYDILSKLYEQNPAEHCFNLLVCEANQTKALVALQRWEDALSWNDKGLKLLDEFVASTGSANPLMQFYMLAMRVIILDTGMQRKSEARQLSEEVLQIDLPEDRLPGEMLEMKHYLQNLVK